jgi:Protein of unknown function (DUF2975)
LQLRSRLDHARFRHLESVPVVIHRAAVRLVAGDRREKHPSSFDAEALTSVPSFLSFINKETTVPKQHWLTRHAAVVVQIARVANVAFLVAVAVGVMVSWVAPAWFAAALLSQIPAGDVAEALKGARLSMGVGMGMSLATARLLRALAAMVDSARTGDPFVADNADRLQTIGWCLLGLQLLEAPTALLRRHFPSMGSAAPSGDISIAGWIAVLMVFVLSQVFRVGTQMREELDGTV